MINMFMGCIEHGYFDLISILYVLMWKGIIKLSAAVKNNDDPWQTKAAIHTDILLDRVCLKCFNTYPHLVTFI